MNQVEHKPIPLIVLAGSDKAPASLPQDGVQLHPLKGSKGHEVKIHGRPIIELLLEQIRGCRCFDPVFVAAPAAIYGEECQGCRIIDTDKTFGTNVVTAVQRAADVCPDRPLAITTCDILPTTEELERVMEDYFRHAPLDFWFPLVSAPREARKLGASFWKPQYSLTPHGEPAARKILPGHLVVVDPAALRLPLIRHSFDLAYRSRNRSILYRLWLILSHLFLGLIVQDIMNLSRGRPPTITLDVIFQGVALSLHLRKGIITPEESAARLRKIFVRRGHRRRHPDRRGRLPLVDEFSLAKDIDTQEEAREIAGRA
jgi:hypothetical protein